MIIKQLRDFDVRPRRDARRARVNVELEQSAHGIDFWTIDGQVQRSLAIEVDRVLIDAVQRANHLARACAIQIWCFMQRRPAFVFFNKISVSENNRHFLSKQKSSTKLTLRCFAQSQSRPKQTASAAHRCARWKQLHVSANLHHDTSWYWSEPRSKIIIYKRAYPFKVSTWILAPF